MRTPVQERVGTYLMVTAAVLLMAGCAKNSESPEPTAARAKATRMLEVIQAERWSELADFVSLDSVTQERLGIPEGATPETSQAKIADWFETHYKNVPPGAIHSVEIEANDPTLAIVTYTAGDLDSFIMRRVDGEWYYTLDWRPKPD